MGTLPVAGADRLLTSWSRGEDAALWRIDDDRIGILTVDFITPVVDDPRRYGEIAAANALSDVFAMGGRPLVALNVVGFPTSCQPIGMLQEILNGGADKVIEAGAVLAGGHSIQDDEPKYGLVVFGEVKKGDEWRVDGAKTGDVLILTKPLGIGIAATAIKAGFFSAEDAAYAAATMAMLNDIAPADLPGDLRAAIHACTDVTGFGLAGHVADMVSQEQDVEIFLHRLPLLPGVREMADMGMLPAGSYANREHSGKRVDILADSPEDRRLAEDMLFDPQTSGGLLLAVAPDAAEEIEKRLRGRFPHAAAIGAFAEGRGRLRIA